MANMTIEQWVRELQRIINDGAQPDGHPTVRGCYDSVKVNRFYVECRDDEGLRLLTVEVTDEGHKALKRDEGR